MTRESRFKVCAGCGAETDSPIQDEFSQGIVWSGDTQKIVDVCPVCEISDLGKVIVQEQHELSDTTVLFYKSFAVSTTLLVSRLAELADHLYKLQDGIEDLTKLVQESTREKHD